MGLLQTVRKAMCSTMQQLRDSVINCKPVRALNILKILGVSFMILNRSFVTFLLFTICVNSSLRGINYGGFQNVLHISISACWRLLPCTTTSWLLAALTEKNKAFSNKAYYNAFVDEFNKEGARTFFNMIPPLWLFVKRHTGDTHC